MSESIAALAVGFFCFLIGWIGGKAEGRWEERERQKDKQYD